MPHIPTPSVGTVQQEITHSIVAQDLFRVHSTCVITREQLLARLNELVKAGEIRNVDIARVLELPDSRIPALLRGERRIYFDEATRLVSSFGLERGRKRLESSVMRLAVRHVSSALKAEPDEARVADLAEDLRAFFEYVADPKVQDNLTAVEAFFQAMRLRRPASPAETPPESDPERTH